MNVNRRSFLIGSATAAGAAFAQSEGTVKTAMIGVGNRGSYLLQAVMAQPVAKVVALCDIKPDRLDKAATAAARDNPQTYSDWRRVIDRNDVEAVYIATPPYLHSEMAIAAIHAGKHVYCEKPIGVNPAQVKALVAAAKGNKKVFMAGQQMRSQKQLAEAVRKIHEGAAGDLIMLRAQRHATGDIGHQSSSADWYFDVAKSGGYLIEQSVHNLDCCNWVINAHPVKCSGFGGIGMYKNDPPGRTIYDHGCLTFEYSNGVKMTFTQNTFHPRGLILPNQAIHVFGTKGAVDLLYSTTFYPLAQGAQPAVLAEKQQEDQHAHIAAFYACVLKGAPNPADITIGATAALTSIMAHEAIAKEKVINWSDLGVNV